MQPNTSRTKETLPVSSLDEEARPGLYISALDFCGVYTTGGDLAGPKKWATDGSTAVEILLVLP